MKPIAQSAYETRDPKNSPYIVGIGASAGGLTAFTQLLRSLPANTGMSFVIIQHLSPKHESLLPEILSRETSMPVNEVVSGMRVMPNSIYVIPPGVNMTIKAGVLELSERDLEIKVPLPIDAFFGSLASDQGDRAIAVVLSGTGQDGAEGAKIVKLSGGISFAQSPESAQYSSMPTSAIRIDHIDFVLDPEKIALELARISHSFSEPLREDQSFDQIIDILKRNSGTDFSQYKTSTLKRRLSRRLVLRNSASQNEYVEILKKEPKECQALAEDILIHVTEFFREPEAFEVLKRDIFPMILREKRTKPIRIWVPACSTGEEPYSIAMALCEFFDTQEIAPNLQIFATDLSGSCIEKARLGKFGSHIAHTVPKAYLDKYFVKEEDGFRITKRIRDFCIFAKHDLTRDAPYSKLNLISCRNILIYFNPMLQNRLMQIFHYSLVNEGFLLLGKSENIGLASALFTALSTKIRVFLKKPATLSGANLSWRGPSTEVPNEIHSNVSSSQVALLQMHAEISRAILSRFTPPSVVINSDFKVLQFMGRTQSVLNNQGSSNLDLFRMVDKNMATAISTLVAKAKQANASVNDRFKFSDNQASVDVDVTPLLILGSECFLIVFGQSPYSVENEQAGSKKKRKEIQSENIDFENELAITRSRLAQIVRDYDDSKQELQSANEEVISANEELQSANEELETSKEELQSTNEELNTVNDELQSRNQDLFTLNNDLINLLNSFQLPVIIVGADLSIRRFTPTASLVLNVKTGDVGRPITDITSDFLDVSILVQAIRGVVEKSELYETEMQDKNGHWYQLRVRPYRTQDQRMDGAVITMFDVDQFKQNLKKSKSGGANET